MFLSGKEVVGLLLPSPLVIHAGNVALIPLYYEMQFIMVHSLVFDWSGRLSATNNNVLLYYKQGNPYYCTTHLPRAGSSGVSELTLKSLLRFASTNLQIISKY